MKSIRYLLVDIKIIFRMPISVFFTMAYPVIMMIIIMVSYGNIDIGSGYHLIDKYFMVTIGMGLLPLALVSFPIWIASSMEDNSLKRLTYFDVPFSTIVSADTMAHFVIAFISIFLNITVGMIFYGLKLPSALYFLTFILQYMIALIVCMICGAFIALLLPKVQALMPVGLVLMFSLYMLCGVFINYDELPQTIRSVSQVFPIKYAMNDFFDIWTQEKYLDMKFLALSLIYIVVFGAGLAVESKIKFKKWHVSKREF